MPLIGRKNGASGALPPIERSIAPHSVLPNKFWQRKLSYRPHHKVHIRAYLELDTIFLGPFFVIPWELEPTVQYFIQSLQFCKELVISARILEMIGEERGKLIQTVEIASFDHVHELI